MQYPTAAEVYNLSVKAKLNIMTDNTEERIHFKMDAATIQMDENYLTFILFELIDNATKFSALNQAIFFRVKTLIALFMNSLFKI